MNSTRHSRRLAAPRALVYRALLDPLAIERWRFPVGMTCEVHQFDAREGGAFRVSLTYHAPTSTGKSSAQTDTYHGHFRSLVPNECIVEVIEFESDDPAMQGEMTIRTTLLERDGETELEAIHENLPAGVSPEDNHAGWNDALDRLEALLASGYAQRA